MDKYVLGSRCAKLAALSVAVEPHSGGAVFLASNAIEFFFVCIGWLVPSERQKPIQLDTIIIAGVARAVLI